MTHRIQWNERVDNPNPNPANPTAVANEQENDDTRFNSCNLLWQV